MSNSTLPELDEPRFVGMQFQPKLRETLSNRGEGAVKLGWDSEGSGRAARPRPSPPDAPLRSLSVTITRGTYRRPLRSFAEEPLGGQRVSARLHQHVEHVAVLVDRTAQVVDRAI